MFLKIIMSTSILAFALAAASSASATDYVAQAEVPFNDINWKVVLMTGDDSITAFDNARKKIGSQFESFGMDLNNLRQLSRKASEQRDGVLSTSVTNFQNAMNSLEVGEGDGCVVHMTSHGTTRGFYIRGQGYLSPSKLDQILDQACGEKPTVVLISACYAGVFAEQNMQAPNRFIMVAARKDRTSFGCSPDAVYTYWDTCLIENMETSVSWTELSGKVKTCIERKESRAGVRPSYPQVRIGSEMENMAIFSK